MAGAEDGPAESHQETGDESSRRAQDSSGADTAHIEIAAH